MNRQILQKMIEFGTSNFWFVNDILLLLFMQWSTLDFLKQQNWNKQTLKKIAVNESILSKGFARSSKTAKD